MPKSIPKGLTRQHVLSALVDLDKGASHPFSPAKGYDLLHGGKRYPPKAVVGIAVKYLTGKGLTPKDFSAGEGPGQANSILRRLDFIVVSRVSNDLTAQQLSETAEVLDQTGYFSVASLEDEREKRLREITQRRGQPLFRSKLIIAYRGRCAVTGCDAVNALEAAHIVPYLGLQSNDPRNGLLLRADIHTLFDLDLIGIDPETFTVSLAPEIESTAYANLNGQKIAVPLSASDVPSQDALTRRWQEFKRSS